ncbi:MAG TPA: putative glycolipid-binding domain-containing protein [Acidimicrobiia bacterium]|jgi:hypothetical protein
MASIMWRRIDRTSLERCVLEATATGHRLAGTVLTVVESVPCEIRYTVIVDAAWRTTTVGVSVQGTGNDRTLALTTDGTGAWSAGDSPAPDLHGADDVSFGWTPSTSTIPIRRLALDVGAFAEVPVARIGFPEREVERTVHRYERLAERRYRLHSGDFQTDLTVNEHGLVTAYPGGWVAEAEE